MPDGKARRESRMLRRFYTVMIVPHGGGALRRLSVSMNFVVSMGAIFLFCFVSSAFLAQFFLGGMHAIGSDERTRAENERLNIELARMTGVLQETSLKLEAFTEKTEELGRADGSWHEQDDGMGGGTFAEVEEESGRLFTADGDWRASTRAILEKADYRLQQIDERLCELHSDPEPPALDDVLWPAQGRITSRFGMRRDPFDGSRQFHEGVDIATKFGADVRVVGDGIVVEARRHGGYGNMVLIDHGNGQQTLYGHLRRYIVEPGQRVKRGTVIGSVGSTGRSTGPHLHFEVLEADKPVDPIKTLSKTPA